MKISIKNLLVIIFLFSITNSFAQQSVPGYLGKRLSVKYNAYVSPAIGNPTRSHSILAYRSENADGNSIIRRSYRAFIDWNWNLRNELSGEYVITRKHTVGINLSMISTKMAFSNNNLYFKNNDVPSNNGDEYQFSYFRSYCLAELSSMSLGMFAKFQHNNSIAPVGLYSKFDIALYNNKVSFSKTELIDEAYEEYHHFGDYDGRSGISDSLIVLDINENSKYNDFYLAYSLGSQRVFNDNIIFDIGMQIGLFSSFIHISEIDIDNDEESKYKSRYSENHYTTTVGKRRLALHNLFNFYIGVGYLIK